MKYRFVGRNGPMGLKPTIPYGEIVERVYWGPRRKVIVKRPNGELVCTMGYWLRKIIV